MRWDEFKHECAMMLFARFYGEEHEYWGGYTWQKLTTAISHLNITVPGEAHDAEHDAAATAHIIKRLAEDTGGTVRRVDRLSLEMNLLREQEG
ncbi:hypothetical protein KSC_024370 [Ktedonobacter sp. SOSP1-52]|nr:hypothetical protein KSC_024370 [Ktedonobacter sp. SOSP1-52]